MAFVTYLCSEWYLKSFKENKPLVASSLGSKNGWTPLSSWNSISIGMINLQAFDFGTVCIALSGFCPRMIPELPELI